MRRRILILTSCLLLAGLALAQSNAPSLAVYPDPSVAVANAGVSISSVLDVAKANIATVFQLQQNDSGAITVLQSRATQDEETIQTLQGANSALAAKLSADEATIALMQAQIKQLQSLTATPAPALNYSIAFSASPTRTPSSNLQGAIVSGSIYIFSSSAQTIGLTNPTGVAKVCFWLDNTAMTGTANHCETAAPYDFADSTGANANPWVSSSVPNGTHTLSQAITLSAGGTENDIATFMVSN